MNPVNNQVVPESELSTLEDANDKHLIFDKSTGIAVGTDGFYYSKILIDPRYQIIKVKGEPPKQQEPKPEPVKTTYEK